MSIRLVAVTVLVIVVCACSARPQMLRTTSDFAAQTRDAKARVFNPRLELTADQICNETANVCSLADRTCQSISSEYMEDEEFKALCNQAKQDCRMSEAKCRGAKEFK